MFDCLKKRPVAVSPFDRGYPSYVFNCPGIGGDVRKHCQKHCRVTLANPEAEHGLVDYDGGGFSLRPCSVARTGIFGRLDFGCALAGAKFRQKDVLYVPPDDHRIKITLELKVPTRQRLSAGDLLDGTSHFESGARGQTQDYL